MILFMSNILLRFNKKDIIAERNTTFYKVFKKKIRGHLKEIIPQVPDIGNSIFKSSYLIGVAFIAWYKAFLEMGLSSDEANIWIWKGTENAIKKIPRFMIPLVKKSIWAECFVRLRNRQKNLRKEHCLSMIGPLTM